MDETDRSELFRERTRDVILAMRAQYLASGANALTHWDQITARARAALQMHPTAARWMGELARTLRIGAPSNSTSSAMLALEAEVDGRGLSAVWREAMRHELPLVMAEARFEAEARKERREGAKHA